MPPRKFAGKPRTHRDRGSKGGNDVQAGPLSLWLWSGPRIGFLHQLTQISKMSPLSHLPLYHCCPSLETHCVIIIWALPPTICASLDGSRPLTLRPISVYSSVKWSPLIGVRFEACKRQCTLSVPASRHPTPRRDWHSVL